MRWNLIIRTFTLFVLVILPLSSSLGIEDLLHYREKCYRFIGCYSCAPPFGGVLLYRFLCNLPADHLKVTFQLYTRENWNDTEYLHLGNGTSSPNDTIDTMGQHIASSSIKPGLPLKVLIPGFLAQVKSDSSFQKIKNELLKYGDYNVVIVDWTGDNNFPYEQAFGNARVVGGLTGLVLQLIQGYKGIKYENMHLIGHSLGAHIAGWAGERIKEGIGRITGLDPAGVYFQKAPDEVRLDKTDAKFVDVIHTSAGHNVIQGYGIEQPIGDVDFYPNGGKRQPYCGKSTLFNFWKVGACAHTVSQDYFRSSILKCKFEAVRCQNYDEFTSGRCNYNNSDVNEMGFHAKRMTNNKTANPRFYLFTTSSYPFCNADNSPVLQDQNKRQDGIIYFFVYFLSLPISLLRKLSDVLSFHLDAFYTITLNLF